MSPSIAWAIGDSYSAPWVKREPGFGKGKPIKVQPQGSSGRPKNKREPSPEPEPGFGKGKPIKAQPQGSSGRPKNKREPSPEPEPGFGKGKPIKVQPQGGSGRPKNKREPSPEPEPERELTLSFSIHRNLIFVPFGSLGHW